MPRYSYHCSSCNQEFEITHSIKEKIDDCLMCHYKGTAKKIPLKFNKIEEKYNQNNKKINAAISENKESLKEFKEQLLNRKHE